MSLACPLNNWLPMLERYNRVELACKVIWKQAILIPVWGSTSPSPTKPEPLPRLLRRHRYQQTWVPGIASTFPVSCQYQTRQMWILRTPQSSSPLQPEITCSETNLIISGSWVRARICPPTLSFEGLRPASFWIHSPSWPSMHLEIQSHRIANLLPKIHQAWSS